MSVSATFLLMLAAAASHTIDRNAADRCAAPGADKVASLPSQTPRARPLNQMPPARAVLSVDRHVDGCRVLLIKEGERITEEPVGQPERRRVFRP